LTTDAVVSIQRGLAEIQVHRSGLEVEGAKVYLFTGAGSYLGLYEITDSLGKAGFILPEREYKFRADEGGDQVWSAVITPSSGQVSNVELDLDGMP
jgi:hypothetical protein